MKRRMIEREHLSRTRRKSACSPPLSGYRTYPVLWESSLPASVVILASHENFKSELCKTMHEFRHSCTINSSLWWLQVSSHHFLYQVGVRLGWVWLAVYYPTRDLAARDSTLAYSGEPACSARYLQPLWSEWDYITILTKRYLVNYPLECSLVL